MPVAWMGDSLFIKTVPKPGSGSQVEGGPQSDAVAPTDSSVSLSFWSLGTSQVTSVPSVKITSSSEHLLVEPARLVQVSTELVNRPGDIDIDQDLDSDSEDEGLGFTVKAVYYDFWNLVK